VDKGQPTTLLVFMTQMEEEDGKTIGTHSSVFLMPSASREF